ncbi:MAG: ECF transporter S component [Solobacterium sp.]|nr:ECF transporter S component [Solobacterium sp.]
MRNTKQVAVLGIFTGIVVILQLLGSFIRLGTFSISLVWIPIVLGAVLYGPLAGAWLGLVFSIVVLIMDSGIFMAINPPATILIVLVKGIVGGLAAGWIYRLVKGYNRYVGVVAAAVAGPLCNTGIFILGCLTFFGETMAEWASGLGFGDHVVQYVFVGLVGANFLVELLISIILSPTLFRLAEYFQKRS